MRDYTLIRSERKTAVLRIRDGQPEVHAPMRMPKSRIDEFVALKEDWIVKKLAESEERRISRENFNLNYGDLIRYRGETFPITAVDDGGIGFDGERFYMPPGLSSDEIKQNCIKIYRDLAMEYLSERTRVYAEQMSVEPALVKISNAQKKWGSCYASKRITFVWRLMMADDGAIDYVVVHELAHLVHMNHSPQYWAVVESVMPDYRERKKRLAQLAKSLRFENW